MADKPAKLTKDEILAIDEDMRKKSRASIKNFFIGMAKSVTTDLPGFLMDVADKLIDPKNVSFGEFDRSAELFEKLTGIKTKSGSGGVDELIGGMVNPVSGAIGAAKAIIVPAIKLGKDVDRAKTLAKAGMSPVTIFEQTGAYKEGGVWKAALSDADVKIKPEGLKNFKGLANLDDILDAEKLFDIYPELKNTKVMFTEGVDGAVIYPGKGKLPHVVHVNPEIAASNQLKSVLIHEVQHGIQEAEKFSKGTSVASVLQRNPNLSYQQAFDIYRNVPGEQEASFAERTSEFTQAQLGLEIKKLLQAESTPGNPASLFGDLDRFVGVDDPSQVIVPAVIAKGFKAAKEGKKLLDEGVDAATVFRATGTFPGVTDSALRGIISDELATLQFGPGLIERSASPLAAYGPTQRLSLGMWENRTLGDILDHPELFAKIPELKDIPVKAQFGGFESGAYSPGNKTIYMGAANTPEKFKSILMHEVQHGIQDIFDFTPGGNSGMFYADEKTFDLAVDALRNVYSNQLNSSMPMAATKPFRQMVEDAQEILTNASDKAFKNYQNLGGEVEARAVQKLLEKPQLANTLPLDYYDVDNLADMIADPSTVDKVDLDPKVKAILEFMGRNPTFGTPKPKK